MNKFGFLAFLCLLTFLSFAQEQIESVDKNGNKYTHYSNDPSNTRWYKTNNGLTVILSANVEKPRVQTLIATKAGSSSDPADNTGLAHYLEHMLFKGTDKYGTLDFEKEKALLDQIDNLYEQYNSEKDEEKRKQIYKEIDRVSGEAAKFAIANEYDKMLQSIGAKGTNAFTSFEQTVYVNDIPSNQIEKWLQIEGERFRQPVLRLFHTELEAVYEEKNRTLDNDRRKVFEALFKSAFPNHNYGRQTTIGTIEHLKNPSLKKIRKYYNTYYVPNNMAVIMVGDIDLAETFMNVRSAFGYMKAKNVPQLNFQEEVPLEKNDVIEVVGPDAEAVTIGYRVPSALSDDATLVELVDLIFANSKAGLIDLNLVKAQKCLYASASPVLLKDRGLHQFVGRPLEGQSLEQVEQLLYGEIEKLKNGDFNMGLVKSIILNQKVSNIRQFESYQGTAYSLLSSFVLGSSWSEELSKLDKMLTYSKEDIQSFAKKYYNPYHTIIYKRKGEKPKTISIEKPPITKVEVNRGKVSPFNSEILEMKVKPVPLQSLNYKEEIIFDQTAEGLPIWKVKNGDEQLFSLYYVLDIGSHHDLRLAKAVNYLKYVGTKKMSADQVSEEFYKLACNFGVSTNKDQSYVYLNGLASNFDDAIKLFENLLKNASPDQASLDRLVARNLKSRADNKLNKNVIFRRLAQFAAYGPENPSTHMLSEQELKSLTAEELVTHIKNLTSYKHKVWYSGPMDMTELKKCLKKYHKVPNEFIPSPELKKFDIKETKPEVFFTPYDMVQAEIMWLKKSSMLNLEDEAVVSLHNEYFGGGMSSIVFQEIRESKALAYSTYSYYATPSKLGEFNRVVAYVGTQADKLKDGVKAMNTLLEDLPEVEDNLMNAKVALRQNLETSRILKTGILFSYDQMLKLGQETDNRKKLATEIDAINMDQLVDFHNTRFSGDYSLCIMGSEASIDLEEISKYGDLKVVTLEEIFGY